MSLAYDIVQRQGFSSVIAPGDVILSGESVAALSTVGAGTLTAALMLAGIIRRTGPVGAYADTTDSAANIIAAMAAASYVGTGANVSLGVGVGTTWRLQIINTVAFAGTFTAGANVNLVGGNTAIAASSTKTYLCTVVNGTPQQVLQGDTTNASATVLINAFNAKLLQNVTAGMAVSGTGIQAGTTVLAVQPNKSITLSLAANATNAGTVLTFNPIIQIESLGQTLL